MKASELIERLQALVAERGDADVTIPDSGCGCCAGDEGVAADTLRFTPAHMWGLDLVPDRFLIDY